MRTNAIVVKTPHKRETCDFCIDGVSYCSSCSTHKPTCEFPKDPSRKDGVSSWCRPCRKANDRRSRLVRRDSDPQKYRLERRAATRRHQFARIYGITLHDYDQMLTVQGGVCAICHQPEIRKGRGGDDKPLAVDHCHVSGKVRGLLCDACNNMLGRAHDDPQRLRAAADYLEASQCA